MTNQNVQHGNQPNRGAEVQHGDQPPVSETVEVTPSGGIVADFQGGDPTPPRADPPEPGQGAQGEPPVEDTQPDEGDDDSDRDDSAS